MATLPSHLIAHDSLQNSAIWFRAKQAKHLLSAYAGCYLIKQCFCKVILSRANLAPAMIFVHCIVLEICEIFTIGQLIMCNPTSLALKLIMGAMMAPCSKLASVQLLIRTWSSICIRNALCSGVPLHASLRHTSSTNDDTKTQYILEYKWKEVSLFVNQDMKQQCKCNWRLFILSWNLVNSIDQAELIMQPAWYCPMHCWCHAFSIFLKATKAACSCLNSRSFAECSLRQIFTVRDGLH